MLILFIYLSLVLLISFIYCQHKIRTAKAIYYIYLFDRYTENDAKPEAQEINKLVDHDWRLDSRQLLKCTHLLQSGSSTSPRSTLRQARQLGFVDD